MFERPASAGPRLTAPLRALLDFERPIIAHCIDKALVLGDVGSTKTRRNRTVPLLAPLRSDLAEWKLASGTPGALVFPMRDGRPFTDSAYRNWRSRDFGPAAEAAGLDTLRPYDLRHSFASLLLAEQRNPRRNRGGSRALTRDAVRHLRARNK